MTQRTADCLELLTVCHDLFRLYLKNFPEEKLQFSTIRVTRNLRTSKHVDQHALPAALTAAFEGFEGGRLELEHPQHGILVADRRDKLVLFST